MSDRVPASGTVHWVGAGLSTGSGLAALCAHTDRVRLWHRTATRAAEALHRLGLTGRAEPRAYTLDALTAELAPGDVVVSMLPASGHTALLSACVARRAHFACSSYVSDEFLELAPAAADAGTVVLTEAGLDPGIDHLFAHRLVARAREAIGDDTAASYRLTSYCGGVPAVPDAFRYRFSWAPLGVLNALRAPARYVEDGRETVAARPWEATRALMVGGESFEAYPNRDSVPFIAQYALPPSWRPQTFVRGTLRLDGWLRAWEPVFEELRGGRRHPDRGPGPGVGGRPPHHRRRPRPRGPRRVAGGPRGRGGRRTRRRDRRGRRYEPLLVRQSSAGPGGRRDGERDGPLRLPAARPRRPPHPGRLSAAGPEPGRRDRRPLRGMAA
ncbi:hypothetical protein QF032_006622 [Streptomyces achromogenes]|nr:hypothetical protein [Streptomyces achromogenes]